MPPGKRTVQSYQGPQNAWLKSGLEKSYYDSYTMDESNGTTNYGKVESGTIMGLLNSGKVRPIGKTTGSTSGASTTLTVADTTGFFVGDPIYDDGVDTGETVASVDSATQITASGAITVAASSVIATDDGNSAAISALGILLRDKATFEPYVDQAGAAIHSEGHVLILTHGVVDESALANNAVSAGVKSDLAFIDFV